MAISGQKVYELINMLKEKQALGVQITIVTWTPGSYRFGDAAYWMQLDEDMRKVGFYIKTVEESCERFAIIDQEVVWYGNINLLAKVWKHHDHYYMVQGGRKKRYPQALDFPLANKSNLQYTSLRFTKDRRENA